MTLRCARKSDAAAVCAKLKAVSKLIATYLYNSQNSKQLSSKSESCKPLHQTVPVGYCREKITLHHSKHVMRGNSFLKRGEFQ
jgi:hypothetical protein